MKHLLKNKKNMLAVLTGSAFLCVLFSVVAINLNNTGQESRVVLPKINAPTAFPNTTQTTTYPQQGAISYSTENTKKLIDKINNPVPLRPQDQLAKQTILNQIFNQSTIVIDDPLYRIEYIKSLDQFLIDIKTADTIKAKQQAKGWFLSHGFTDFGLCDMPVVFYVDPGIISLFKGSKITTYFDQMADGC
jgi:hypothetical protein